MINGSSTSSSSDMYDLSFDHRWGYETGWASWSGQLNEQRTFQNPTPTQIQAPHNRGVDQGMLLPLPTSSHATFLSSLQVPFQASSSTSFLLSAQSEQQRRLAQQVNARILNLDVRSCFSSQEQEYSSLSRIGKRCRPNPVALQAPACQAQGCMADLSSAKHYHRRHKVCEFHSKATTVTTGNGQTQRFCQQCSRFHALSEFDDGKRSCRRRLADHNRRRRKPQPPAACKAEDETKVSQPTASGSGSCDDQAEHQTVLSNTGAHSALLGEQSLNPL